MYKRGGLCAPALMLCERWEGERGGRSLLIRFFCFCVFFDQTKVVSYSTTCHRGSGRGGFFLKYVVCTSRSHDSVRWHIPGPDVLPVRTSTRVVARGTPHYDRICPVRMGLHCSLSVSVGMDKVYVAERYS